MNNLPHWAKDVLRSCPQAKLGVHRWLFRAACTLHRCGCDENEIGRLLSEATAHCGRVVLEKEIDDAIFSSARVTRGGHQAASVARRWPKRDENRIRSLTIAGPTLAELASQSPVQWSDETSHTEQVINTLFPGNPLLCAGPSQRLSVTQTREEWRGRLEKQQFIVPNPMTERFGKTQAGAMSRRSLSNTGSRRFIVIEFDTGTFDEHAAIVSHLATIGPLVLAVHSGNKSLHSWFYCASDNEATIEKFFGYAVSLGADPATWTRCQLVRMPDGHRGDGRRQQIVYFNPKGVTN